MVGTNLESLDMPPEGKPQPSKSERAMITHWIEASILGCDCEHPDPGRVTIRRLNRAEYNNTIRDLTGVNFQPAEDFPLDDIGYGFDNIGDVLSLSPMLMEKYVAAAAYQWCWTRRWRKGHSRTVSACTSRGQR